MQGYACGQFQPQIYLRNGWHRNSGRSPQVHCVHQYVKANRMLGLLRRTFKTRSKPVLLKMYKSVVHPHLEYCSSVWSAYYKKDKELLEKIQHRFTRLFKELRQLTYAERLHVSGLWSLEERRNRTDLVEVYKMVSGQSAIPAEPATKSFEFNTDCRTRGHQFKLKKTSVAKDIRLHFFSERVTNRWNGLLSDVISAKSLNSFKAGLQQMRDTQIDFFVDEQSHKSSGHSEEWPHHVNYQVNYQRFREAKGPIQTVK